jgi:hypothetical protein
MKKKIGAIWKKVSRSGQTYYSGETEKDGVKEKIILFENRNQNENSPSYDICVEIEEEKQEISRTGMPIYEGMMSDKETDEMVMWAEGNR